MYTKCASYARIYRLDKMSVAVNAPIRAPEQPGLHQTIERINYTRQIANENGWLSAAADLWKPTFGAWAACLCWPISLV